MPFGSYVANYAKHRYMPAKTSRKMKNNARDYRRCYAPMRALSRASRIHPVSR